MNDTWWTSPNEAQLASDLARVAKADLERKNQELLKEFAEEPADRQLKKDLEAIKRHEQKNGATLKMRLAMEEHEILKEENARLTREAKARKRQLEQLENSF